MTLALRYAVRSDVGLLREGNEDSAYAGPRLLAVADGMGGHAAGEVASAVTIGAMSELDAEAPGGDMLAELNAAVGAANLRLQQMIMANPAVEGMGTTLTAVLWSDGHAAVCHIGDSRGYLLRQGELYQITHDHTLVQSLVDEGRITEDDVSTHPQRSLLLRALDGRTVAEPDLSVHEAQVGDRYLLCSDGLSSVVSDETLRDTLANIPDPDACTRQLIDLAIRGGGPDNITCIVADVVDISTRPSRTPILAGAAVNGGDPRLGTNPFAAMTGGRAARTAPQPVLTDGMVPPGVNGNGPADAEDPAGQRRGHRGSRRGRTGRRRWPIVTTSLAVLVVVIVAGGFFAYRWTQSQYYVGADKNGEVVIYKGVNQPIAGISLSHPHTYTGIKLDQVPPDYRSLVDATITASSLADAQHTVTNVGNQVRQCQGYYSSLQAWQAKNTQYQAALKKAKANKKPASSVKGNPGSMPAGKPSFQCATAAAYVLPSTLPPGTS
ncbi:MAG TPA: PP2C family serine/threonine-protein phosphatase [Streptosporangiaceae bacterium]|jgi:protein phosphatase